MNYCIIGGGPVGLSLAYVLSQNNKKVTLIERDDKLGGSWKSEWVDGLYFSENSPRVLILKPHMKKFFNQIGMKPKDFSYVYGNYIVMISKFATFFYKIGFNLNDLKIFVTDLLFYKQHNHTVKDWLDKRNFSKGGRRAMEIFSILMCDRPDKTNIQSFFSSFKMNGVNEALKQFKNPDKWHTLVLKHLLDKGAVVYHNTEVQHIKRVGNRITSIRCTNKNGEYTIACDKLFLCTGSKNISNVLSYGDSLIRNNWISESWIKKWCKETYYIGFGFSLHFDVDVKFPYTWCKFCKNDWTVIALPVSNWLEKTSLDNNVKTVWSACIVDVDTKSSFTGKTANESNKEEVIEECLRQIRTTTNIPDPYRITTNSKLRKINGKWVSGKIGFTKNTYGYLPMKGKIDNLFALGSFTDVGDDTVATFGRSIKAVVTYLNTNEKDLIGFHKNRINKPLLTSLIIIFIIFIIYVKKTN